MVNVSKNMHKSQFGWSKNMHKSLFAVLEKQKTVAYACRQIL